MKTGDVVLLRTSGKETKVEFVSAEYNYYEYQLYLEFKEVATGKTIKISFQPPTYVLDIEEETSKVAPIEKKFRVDFFSPGGALTLGRGEVADADVTAGIHEKTHPDGWKIKGCVKEDYSVWVNEFEACHPQYGKVWGDFEETVYADSEEGFQHFYEHHSPDSWDYADI